MKNLKEITNELKEIAPKLASLEKVNRYSVPENYFVHFKAEMLECVKLNGVAEELNAVAPSLAKLEKKNFVAVPANYFTSLSVDLLKKVRANEVADELKAIAPVLSKLEKQHALEVPKNYFPDFPHLLVKQIEAEEKARVKTTSPQWLTGLNSVLETFLQVAFKPKYSVAFAGVISTVIIGVMMFFQVEQCNDLDCKMASLTDSEINSYLDNNTDSYTDEVFETGVDGAGTTNTSNVQIDNDMLHDVSDADLNNALLD